MKKIVEQVIDKLSYTLNDLKNFEIMHDDNLEYTSVYEMYMYIVDEIADILNDLDDVKCALEERE